MLCTNCGKNNATTHIKKTINGITKEYHLCSQCAEKSEVAQEFNSLDSFSNIIGLDSLSPTNIFASLFGLSPSKDASKLYNEKRCGSCGTSFNEIVNSGKAGCANCYDEFSDRMMPIIEKIHGTSKHQGKLPIAESNELKKKKELENLKKEINIAIENQEFEKAAQIRDKIKEIEEVNDND